MAKNRENNKLEDLFNAIEDSVSNDENDAREYLEEQGINHENQVLENIKFIKQLQAKLLLEKGASKQEWFKEKLEQFSKLFKINPDKIQEDLGQLKLQVNFRKLDVENLDDEELQKLLKNAKFLDYLENEFSDDSEAK